MQLLLLIRMMIMLCVQAIRLWLMAVVGHGYRCRSSNDLTSLQILLKYVSIGWFDSLVVMFLRLNYFETKFLIEIDGTLVVHLYVPVNIILNISTFCF